MAQAQTRIEKVDFIGAQSMECLDCHHVDKVSEFGRHITERGGMTVIHCNCPICSASWRRIDVGMQ